jgi:hypothetical protein
VYTGVGRNGLVVPSWLALCWTALGSGFESQRGHSSIISEAPLVCPNGLFIYSISFNVIQPMWLCRQVSEWMLVSVKKDGGLVFHNLNGCIRTINLNK